MHTKFSQEINNILLLSNPSAVLLRNVSENFNKNTNKIIPKRRCGQNKFLQDNVWNNKNQTQTDPFKKLSQSPKDKERLYERTEKSTAKSNTWLSYLAEESSALRERFLSSPGLSAQLFQSYLLQVEQYAKLSCPQHIAPNICSLLGCLSTPIFSSKLRNHALRHAGLSCGIP